MTNIADLSKAKALLAHADLEFPSVPEGLKSDFEERNPWVYSTKSLRLSPYCFSVYVEQGRRKRVRDYMLVAHAGHGINSYALHYYLVKKPLRLFLQIGWGGVYMDNDRAVGRANQCFALASQVLCRLEDAIAAGRITLNDTLVIAGSDFHGTYWADPTGQKHEGARGMPSHDAPQFILTEALKWIIRRSS
jgi:hypothetical protein